MADGLTDDQLRVMRSWVGTSVADSILQERFARLGDLDGAILEEMRAQYAELLANPSNISVDGLSLGYGGNMQAMRERINDFIKVGGTGLDDTPLEGVVGVVQLVRPEVR